MKLIAALEYEKMRSDATSWNKIMLHKDGKFYHIYEWSAWLVKKYVCTEEFQRQRGDKQPLGAYRYKSKESEYAMIGFPLESITKYIGSYSQIEPQEGGDILISIDLSLQGDETWESLNQEFENWRNNCELKTKEDKSARKITNSSGAAPTIARSGMFQIMGEILSYPLENSTPSDNIAFLSSLKQKLSALL